jgi:hypothetical protein
VTNAISAVGIILLVFLAGVVVGMIMTVKTEEE